MPIIDSLPDTSAELRLAARRCASEKDAQQKVAGVIELARAWNAGCIVLDTGQNLTEHEFMPGRPVRPELIPPKLVKHRSMRTVEGRAAMIHALTHIEFNAINLALDAIWRFDGMAPDYYAESRWRGGATLLSAGEASPDARLPIRRFSGT